MGEDLNQLTVSQPLLYYLLLLLLPVLWWLASELPLAICYLLLDP